MRMRRHTGTALDSIDAGRWRGLARDLGLVALTFGVGYAVSSYYITPTAATGAHQAVPRVLGQPLEYSRAALAHAGFRSRIEGDRPSPSVPIGSVVWQDPPPALMLPPNSMVRLVVSTGPAAVSVPDVIGLSLPTAERVVEAAGIRVGRVDTVRGGGEAGVVIATRPAAGNGRQRGGAVDIVVSGAAAAGL